jgi:hypothetical protein
LCRLWANIFHKTLSLAKRFGKNRTLSYHCWVIEPTLLGATAIARLFEDAYRRNSL